MMQPFMILFCCWFWSQWSESGEKTRGNSPRSRHVMIWFDRHDRHDRRDNTAVCEDFQQTKQQKVTFVYTSCDRNTSIVSSYVGYYRRKIVWSKKSLYREKHRYRKVLSCYTAATLFSSVLLRHSGNPKYLLIWLFTYCWCFLIISITTYHTSSTMPRLLMYSSNMHHQ